MRYILLGLAVVTAFACNRSSRKQSNKEGFTVIKERSFVLRERPVKDSLLDSVAKRKDAMVAFLTAHNFKQQIVPTDSIMFLRENGLEVEYILPSMTSVWEAYTIIVFDPLKNPLFVNLHKDTTQLAHYLK
ncbi:hypothetical protein LX64_03749 [Chitinophaga skermanii]|uniref:Lipoprotein n=1 Tax=Chitinophaga skermanii TaxID=331697 RepID=A0A327QCE2_9BACT|nr:hypothetical protein [Chitinophaga skermanii]RAJ01534.1 hypothetical protein LX64_03749 [Chitinophaga skermanii]